ncbi:MAG: hypothetical protein JXQ73_18640 [Phycisphaerae bacterium]|nr:hypothetical protein [Phycisphaerae bacterium]
MMLAHLRRQNLLGAYGGLAGSLLGGLVLLTGCVDPPSDYGPVQADVVVSDGTDFDYLWESTLRTLRRVNLTPDRQDSREGIITTKPITSQQWFEFWRHDSLGPYQWVESSMHTTQRHAIVRIQRQPEPGHYRVSVEVEVFRYSAPERQVSTPSGALLMYSEKLPTEQGERLQPMEDVHWVRLGRDPQLEGLLLRRILNHYPGTYELVEEPFELDEPVEEEITTGNPPPSQEGARGASSPVPSAPEPPAPAAVVRPIVGERAKAEWRRGEPVGPPVP